MSQKYADIIIDISHEALDRTFQYKIPDKLLDVVEVGSLVTVPFGQGNRKRKGDVIGITETPVYDEDKLKFIDDVPEKGLAIEGRLIKLADWIRRNYGSTMIQALQTVMPVKAQVRKTEARVKLQGMELDTPPVIILNDDQRKLVEEFINDKENARLKPPVYLLQGITGSGKTEVYIECIKHCISRGEQAIVLIPEISLASQTVARFKQHFGERVVALHSELNKGEKYRAVMSVKNHEADVIIGPRSALFSPCDRLGLIVMDEEHDGAYKSETTPAYHAREAAIERARLENIPVILGSATPSLESYTMVKQGEFKLWRLDKRPDGRCLPEVHVVDMRQELRKGNKSIVSKELYDMIKERLEKKEQIMLFLNRRGYNSCLSCRSCGDTVMCPHCDVSLSLHKNNVLMCHYCGYTMRFPKECPSCGSKLLGGFGVGTEKIEDELQKLFPGVRTLRLDKDSTGAKGGRERVLNSFRKHEADILVGTQMIVKGHDFPDVTLVGTIIADVSLFENDYRAGERTFQLLTQAAGRAGRGELPGYSIIQTYKPEHYAIQAAKKQDYEDFYETEMAYRRLMKYPPVYNMLVILIQSTEENLASKAACELGDILKKSIGENRNLRMIGPSDASIAKKNDRYRKVIYIKSADLAGLKCVMQAADTYRCENVSVNMDLNPMDNY
jgi:primosomal protein N' (replication factor Y)